ncbi:TadE/TadG family type IV pilus assembly protein [uncultured Gulosibacter sp.]|uniref:TadE/TadG family type IV pilus assembly protein n=1 Tax=uncultured Gulosibacter sp. TaxID=1339167 RepID=UPI002889BD96|nr:TadE/TadG family type IV pilus assembly protein [uncultured Gulosibacter sp.]
MVEWTLVAALLTLLLLAVLQVSFALHVRTTLIDAAAEGARAAGLSGASNADGHIRTRELISAALNDQYSDDIEVTRTDRIITVTVRSPMPLLGLVGIPEGIEVSAHAPVE